MPGRYKIYTDLSVTLLNSLDADAHEIVLEVTYDVYPAREQTMLEPGEPASVSVQTARVVERRGLHEKVTDAPDWLWSMIEADEALEAEMLAEAWECDQAARDDHSAMIREDRMMEARHG